MKHGFTARLCVAVVALVCAGGAFGSIAVAQTAQPLSACGTGPAYTANGLPMPLTQTTDGKLCTNVASIPAGSNTIGATVCVDVHGTQCDFTLPQPISRTALLGAVLSSYALTTGGTAQTVAALNNARQKFFIANSDTTNTGEDLYVNCLGTNPAVGNTSAGTIDLPPRAVFDPDVPPTQACAVIAATTGHTWEGYTQ